MTVKELKKKLELYSDEALIVIYGECNGFDEVSDELEKLSIVEKKEYTYYNGRYAEPEDVSKENCKGKILSAVLFK